ncbi:hypothetical protein GCM10022415_04960 [Knoellia locipacati]|uniref:Uncharacterized protein n=1 Tax=Knoellia locipacati TaxID=882824 RepID=A0A512SWX6_9MICO|nr:hypothetical protein [Knoellia locipacati]GEQ12447.1 hypothetical protein KLO01_04940 [Knoellia locipacati]
MLWLWGTIALVLAVVFVASTFYDRRHKGSTFGEGLETRRHAQDAKNDQDNFGGAGGFSGGMGGGGG